ncbi:MAG TPA: helix-turn-helix transcriptional regulator [Pseudonocardiaceae bacterium]|nr:helix-turn-helix transcriptional regulator [Pseudonocardiaceae bacterium]
MLRHARTELGWSQGELGARFGCSGPTISRFETGRRGLRDVAVLGRFASILGLPAEAFGLTDTASGRHASPGHPDVASKVGAGRSRDVGHEGDDPVRRRAFLLAASGALVGTTVTAGQRLAPGVEVDPAVFLARRLAGVLLPGGPAAARPAPTTTLLAVLADAVADFRACHYVDLAARLPALITAAEATHAQAEEPRSAAVLAQSYNLATRALIKLDASGLEWVSADRAVRAAAQAEDPLAVAEAQRLLGSACRRAGHHDRAQILTLTAADRLQLSGKHPNPRHLALYGVLMCSAGYAAARAGDHDRAVDLLAEADSTTGRLTDHPAQQRALAANVASHRVSAEYVLGNAGTALHHARTARLAQFPDTERRARFLVDVALCFAQWDKPGQAYRSLLAAERAAPGEVRTRATVRRLVTDLLQHPQWAGLPGLRDLATRTHASYG